MQASQDHRALIDTDGASSGGVILPVGAQAATAPPRWRRVLVVAAGYAASPDSRGLGAGGPLLWVAGTLWRALTRESRRRFVRMYRDFYANPRDGEYMAARLGELFADHCPDAAAVVVARGGSLGDGPSAAWAVEVVSLRGEEQGGEPGSDLAGLKQAVRARLRASPFDAAIVVHPDAIGLGQEPLETILRAGLPGRVFALSGRRRLRHLDAEQMRRLRVRRLMAETRFYETWLGRWYRLASAWFVVVDWVSRRRVARGERP